MSKKSLLNWLCLSGVISIIFYFLHDIIGGMNYPGYNWMTQTVSDITAIDSPSFYLATGYVTVYKMLNCMCCGLVCIMIDDEKILFKIGVYLFSIMNVISVVGYTLFLLSSSGYDGSTQSFMRVYVMTALIFLLSIVSLTLIAIGSLRGENKHKVIGILAIVALAFMLIGSVGSMIVPKEIFGLFERFSTYSVVIYTGVLGVLGFKMEE